MDILALCPFSVGALLWEARPAQWSLTVCVKATFTLVHGGESVIAPDQAPIDDNIPWDASPGSSLFAADDLSPLKSRVDVLLSGHAYAPGGLPVPSLVASMRVGDLSKSLQITGDRLWTSRGGQLEPAPPAHFLKMPLRYERAALSVDNPVGLGAEEPTEGRPALPNIELYDAQEDASPGFGPIAPAWPARRELIGEGAMLWAQGVTAAARVPIGAAPPGFDFRFFNAAPYDQQLDMIRSGLPIELENLHPTCPRIETKLPPVRPQVFRVDAETGRVFEVALRCDTLFINSDRGVVMVSWRGLTDVRSGSPEDIGRVVVAADPKGKRITTDRIDKALREETKLDAATEDEGKPNPLEVRHDAVLPRHGADPTRKLLIAPQYSPTGRIVLTGRNDEDEQTVAKPLHELTPRASTSPAVIPIATPRPAAGTPAPLVRPAAGTPAAPKPATPAESAKPAVAAPAAPKPAVTSPAAPKPAVTSPAAPKPAATTPAASKPAVTAPAAPKPAITAPAASKPAVTTPAAPTTPPAAKPALTTPTTPKPAAAKPAAAKPAIATATAPKPALATPAVVKPAAVKETAAKPADPPQPSPSPAPPGPTLGSMKLAAMKLPSVETSDPARAESVGETTRNLTPEEQVAATTLPFRKGDVEARLAASPPAPSTTDSGGSVGDMTIRAPLTAYSGPVTPFEAAKGAPPAIAPPAMVPPGVAPPPPFMESEQIGTTASMTSTSATAKDVLPFRRTTEPPPPSPDGAVIQPPAAVIPSNSAVIQPPAMVMSPPKEATDRTGTGSGPRPGVAIAKATRTAAGGAPGGRGSHADLLEKIGVEEYARIVVAIERGEVGAVLAELSLQLSDLMRIQLDWSKKTASDPALGARAKQAIQAARKRR